ncbi:MAG: glutamate dehydrogenase [Flavobacteriaceae bacterium]|nr:glutamate dehydrogenase [Flavobacteriaceae bacterium]
MKIRRTVGLLLVFIVWANSSLAQKRFSHEIGVFAGPVFFQSDYGLNRNFDTNKGNVGPGIGIFHTFNFSYQAGCNCYTSDKYFNHHFKVRVEANYHFTKLDHFGPLSERRSIGGLQLRSMHGETEVFEVGAQLEWFPWSIRGFDAGQYRLAPYIGLGPHYVTYSPDAYSELGPLGNPITTFPTFLDRIDLDSGSTWALVGYVGTRYKLNSYSDLMFEARWHWYDSNWVDGLSPNIADNKNNDWIFWIAVGYVYYLDW